MIHARPKLFMVGVESHYSAQNIEARILGAVRTVGLNPDERLSPVELGALDHFHTGGFRASLALKRLAQIQAEDRVLDLGAGLAGPARMLAASVTSRSDATRRSSERAQGCRVRDGGAAHRLHDRLAPLQRR